jgi:hypothetical protein
LYLVSEFSVASLTWQLPRRATWRGEVAAAAAAAAEEEEEEEEAEQVEQSARQRWLLKAAATLPLLP